MTVREVLEEVLKDKVFYYESGGGVTISGGEPLRQADFVEALLPPARPADAYCSRYLRICRCRRLAQSQQIRRSFLLRREADEQRKSPAFTGEKNDLILENLKMLAESGSAITVRVPILPGVNDDDENFDGFDKYLSPLGVREIDLIPITSWATTNITG